MQKKCNVPSYSCFIWVQSTSLKSLKLWVCSLPLSPICFNLPIRLKRFTLVRSPLGNKTSKEQYEKREYCAYLHVSSKEAPEILAFLELTQQVIGVKIKCCLSLSSLSYNSVL